jgi:hypothetical protein
LILMINHLTYDTVDLDFGDHILGQPFLDGQELTLRFRAHHCTEWVRSCTGARVVCIVEDVETAKLQSYLAALATSRAVKTAFDMQGVHLAMEPLRFAMCLHGGSDCVFKIAAHTFPFSAPRGKQVGGNQFDLRVKIFPPRAPIYPARRRLRSCGNCCRSSSVFVCLFRHLSSSRFSEKTRAKTAVKNTIQI